MSTDRRTFLRLLSSGAFASAIPASIQRALALPAHHRTGTLEDVEHIVILMQENRSFDHYFGTMAGVRGFGDDKALILPSGKSVFYQPDEANPRGYLLPFHLDTRATSAQKIPSTSHAWDVQHGSWNGGKMDNWLPAHRQAEGAKAPYVMGCTILSDSRLVLILNAWEIVNARIHGRRGD